MARRKNPNGMGNIYQRKDGRYVWKQTIDGETRTISSMSLKDLKEQIKIYADMPITNNKYKVDDYATKWLELYVKPFRSKSTYLQYKGLYDKHVKPLIGNRLIKKIEQVDIVRIVVAASGSGKSSGTAKAIVNILKLIFDKAKTDGIVPKNPVFDIELPRAAAKPKKTLTPGELSKIIHWFKSVDSRWLWIFRFMLVTGVRRGEALALEWSDIDYKNKRIEISKAFTSNGLGATKNSKVHYAPLSDLAIEYLNEQKNMLEAEFNPMLHNEELKKLNLVFPSQSGKHITPVAMNIMFKRIEEKTGVKLTPHMLRHTFVYNSKGLLSLSELKEALGHSDTMNTLDVYGTMLSSTEIVSEKIDTAFKKLNEEMTKIETKNIDNVINLFDRKKKIK